jgi:hypothetical protein
MASRGTPEAGTGNRYPLGLGLLADLFPLAEAAAPERYAHGSRFPAVVPPDSVVPCRVELPEDFGGNAQGLELFYGVWCVDVVEGTVPDERALPLAPLSRRWHAVGVQSGTDAIYRSPRSELGNDPPDYGHLLHYDIVGVAIGSVTEAIVREAPSDDLALPRLLAPPRGGPLRYLLTLPLGEVVLHTVADPVASVVHGLQ